MEGQFVDWGIMLGCFFLAGWGSYRMAVHLDLTDPYNRYRVKNLAFRLTHPRFWVQNHPTSIEFDKWLNAALDTGRISISGDYDVSVAGHEVWTSNYPYASARCRARGDGMALPLTRIRLHRMRKALEREDGYWAQQLRHLNAQSTPPPTPVRLQENTLVSMPRRTKRRTKIDGALSTGKLGRMIKKLKRRK